MSEETVMILRMVREGKITPEQGAELLRAMGDEDRPVAAPSPPAPPAPPDYAPPPPGNGHPSGEAIGEVQTRLADLQARLAEMQARLGAAQASSPPPGRGQGFNYGFGNAPFGLGDLNIGKMVDEAVRGVSSLKTEAVRMAKQAAREAQREAQRFRHEARKAGRQFRVEFNFDFGDNQRPANTAGFPEEKVTNTLDFDLPEGKLLRVVNPFGNVRVVGSAEDGKMHVEETRTAWAEDDTERQELIEAIQMTVSTDESGTVVACTAEEDTCGALIDLVLSVPPATPVEVETGFGDIHCEELTAGAPKVESASGNVTVLHMQGDESAAGSVQSKSGEVAVLQWKGGEIKAESVSGGVRGDGIKAPRAHVRSRSGNVSVANIDIGVQLNAESVSGGIELRGGQCGQELFLRSQSGDISLSQIRTGRVLSETVSGDQTVDQVSATNGPLVVKSVSGDVEVRDTQASEATISTVSGDGALSFAAPFDGTLAGSSVSGDLDIRLWSNSNVKLDMSTQSGDMKCDLPLEEPYGDGNKHLSGKLGAGTGSIRLQSVSGDLHVHSVQ